MAEKIVKFEDLEVWKEGMNLAARIYRELKDCRDFGILSNEISEELLKSTRKISAMLYNYIKIRQERF